MSRTHVLTLERWPRRYPRGGHFVRKAFHRWFTSDTIEWFRERGVELKREEDGRMFPVSDDSQTVIDCLMKEVNRYGVEIWQHAEVVSAVAGGMVPGLPRVVVPGLLGGRMVPGVVARVFASF
ncbi:NAD(P)/FAD-dependent oxidoreductase [Puia sp. P3]|uniref:NAD(P)/FAD-dependent oxidoreductase n=1 Tax=Puia sp. P3 TaxID=3423952 RepID=UPI003D66F72A